MSLREVPEEVEIELKEYLTGKFQYVFVKQRKNSKVQVATKSYFSPSKTAEGGIKESGFEENLENEIPSDGRVSPKSAESSTSRIPKSGKRVDVLPIVPDVVVPLSNNQGENVAVNPVISHGEKESGNIVVLPSEVLRKKRGRPPKKEVANESKPEEEVIIQQPRKRGRPRKE